ncbi:hypothetical protein [Clostridium akagii]|uniref:hypothetical protein n=1 Tax=Clostridium akagii TaxID=91623 RepID=UPI00047AB257|nr:hypothetical protein [Clostridium akagii]
MNHVKKTILCIIAVVVAIEFTSCYYDKNTKVKENLKKNNIKFSDTMALSMDKNGEKAYNLKDGNVLNSGSLSKVENISYSIQKKTWIYTKNIGTGINLSNNYVSIDNKGKAYNINKSYSYADVRLSNSGNYIALRSFKTDNLGSAEGMGVYSTNGGNKINFDKNVLVSGDLYRWINNDTLLYYGVEASQNGYGKIYGYDFPGHSPKVVFDKFKGYCTFFLPLENGDIIYVENDSNVYNMFYYEKASDKINTIGSSIQEIFDYTIDTKNNNIYMLGKDENTSEIALYRYDLIAKNINRITYDFPSIVDKSGGIAVDSLGKVYFCGIINTTSINNSIYMYDISNNSVNLISKIENNYHIISGEN